MTSSQIITFIMFLQAFGVDPQTVAKIQGILTLSRPQTTIVATTTPVIPQQPIPAPTQQPTPQAVPAPTPIIQTPPISLGNTQQTNTSPTSPVVVLPTVTPLIISKVEVSPGGYLRVFTNKLLASTTINAGTLDAPLLDNYPLDADGFPLCIAKDGKTIAFHGHVYEYKLNDAPRPFTATMTDQDGQTFATTVQ